MDTQNRYEELGGYAEWLIKQKSAQLVQHEGFTEADREDIEQDLAVAILLQRSKFDPERSKFETFVARVIDSAIAKMIKARKVAKRGYRRCSRSLNEPVPNGRGGFVELGQVLDQDARLGRNGSRSEQELCDLRMDVAQALDALSPRLRRVCELLKEKTPRELAKEDGIPLSTTYDAIREIRAHFERLGLAEYSSRNRRTVSEDLR